MKRIYNIMLVALAALVTVSCVEPYEKHYNLSIDSDSYNISAEQGKLPITVYASGAWSASLASEVSWAELSRTSGSGVTTILLNYNENKGLSRSTEVVLTAAGLEERIKVVQKAGIAGADIVFLTKTATFAGGSYAGVVACETNLPEESLQDNSPLVAYAPDGEEYTGEEWIVDITYNDTDGEAESDIPLARRGEISFRTLPNTTGAARSATVTLSIADVSGTEYGDSFTVTQGKDAAYITVSDDSVPLEGGSRSLPVASNLGAAFGGVTVEVSYPENAPRDFISNVVLGADALTYDVTENTAAAKRYATITLSHTDLAGEVTSAVANISQRMTVLPREVSFADLRAKFGSVDSTYPGDGDHSDYIVGYIIGEGGNPNMDQNVNTEANLVTTDENDRTNYVQSAVDGGLGLRLKFATAEDNKALRGEKVKIMLDGTTLSYEGNPARYTLKALTAANVVKLADAVALTPKAKSVATLADDDIYTYVSLANMEFSVKRGAYTNVREQSAIDNPIKRLVTSWSSKSFAQPAMDGAANLLYDADNKGIYMLVNMNCTWRRGAWSASDTGVLGEGVTVPQGVGSLCGIVVHNVMPRWGGNVGRYSIRPFDQTDIKIERAAASSWTTLVDWVLDKGSYSSSVYCWNGNTTPSTGFLTGPTAADDVLVQNKLCATEALVAKEKSLLYSENTMRYYSGASTSSDVKWPINITHGYRGLNVQDYDKSVYSDKTKNALFGQSKSTVLTLVSNHVGWYEWDESNNWTGKTNGIVMEFPTEGISGSAAAVCFSIAGARSANDESNLSWTNSSSFPVDWKVEYAVSNDGGATWGSYTEVRNTATGEYGFKLRSLPWSIAAQSLFVSYMTEGKVSNVSTQADWGMGLVPYRFELPAEILGKSMVRVRLTPSSKKIATWTPGAATLNLSSTEVELTLPIVNTGINSAIHLEDVSIQYK